MLSVQIITPLGKTFEGDAKEIVVPTTAGFITVLAGHIPLISPIQTGEIIVRDKVGEHYFAVYSGVIEVKPSHKNHTEVIILANRSENINSIDIERSQKAIERAELAMNEKDIDPDEYARFEALLQKELNRVRVASKRNIR